MTKIRMEISICGFRDKPVGIIFHGHVNIIAGGLQTAN